MWKVGFFKRNR
nr:Chain A, integrin alpha-IIb [synthetic construct]1KUZ_A Chain A, integrin alpha-IIb [synthetic construct]